MLEWDDAPVGHIGLTNIDAKMSVCEIDNVLRGKQSLPPGSMTLALKSLLNWIFATLEMDMAYLNVFADNVRAIALYERCGLVPDRLTPLASRSSPDGVISWVPVPEGTMPAKQSLRMQIRRAAW